MEVDINLLVETNLTPDEYVFLYYLAKGQMYNVNLMPDYDKLERTGFIKQGERIHIRKRGIDLIDNKIPVPKKKVKSEGDTLQWIDEWRDLFPKGVKTAGYAIRGTRGGIP